MNIYGGLFNERENNEGNVLCNGCKFLCMDFVGKFESFFIEVMQHLKSYTRKGYGMGTIICKVCGGSGQVKLAPPPDCMHIVIRPTTCENCNGSGWVAE